MEFGMNDVWREKGATLSHTSAQKEFDLTYEEIIRAMRSGDLQFREGNMHGNPWFRLLRTEVEKLVVKLRGKDYMDVKKHQNELNQINKDLKKLKGQLNALEKRKSELLKMNLNDILL